VISLQLTEQLRNRNRNRVTDVNAPWKVNARHSCCRQRFLRASIQCSYSRLQPCGWRQWDAGGGGGKQFSEFEGGKTILRNFSARGEVQVHRGFAYHSVPRAPMLVLVLAVRGHCQLPNLQPPIRALSSETCLDHPITVQRNSS